MKITIIQILAFLIIIGFVFLNVGKTPDEWQVWAYFLALVALIVTPYIQDKKKK